MWNKVDEHDERRIPSMVEVLHNADRHAQEQHPVEARPIVRTRPHEPETQSKNPLPRPTGSESPAWKSAWFLRCMRTEDMRDASKEMFRLMPPEGLKSPDDVQNWLLRWARLEHGVPDVEQN